MREGPGCGEGTQCVVLCSSEGTQAAFECIRRSEREKERVRV